MKRGILLCLTVLVASRALAASPAGTTQTPLRLLVVTGGHDYPTCFYTLFESEKFKWDHAASNHDAFRSDIRGKYDVLVLYDLSLEISEAEKKNLADFTQGGKGVVALHHAIIDYPDWEWWWHDVTRGKFFSKPEGSTPASSYKHDVDLSVEPVGKHPILTGISRMQINDETYKGMWISPKVQIILKIDNPTADRPLAWVSPFKDSRVVYIQLGHGEPAHRHAAYRRLVHNAILWSGKRLGSE